MDKNTLLKLYNLPVDELLKEAKKYVLDEFELCSLISAKTGKCSQDCKYCAQSSHYNTEIHTHPLVSVEEVERAAKEAKENGVINFAIVTSGKTPEESKDFDLMLEMIKKINSLGLRSCASLGILNEVQVKRLKQAGLKRYHHNINTAQSYHNSICTTHTFEDRINTCKLIKKANIELCCGVIIGMAESIEQRIEMAMTLSEINPDSVPVNILTPIKKTPFENYFDKIDEENILRTCAIIKIANPNSSIRLAGGKAVRLSQKNLELLFENCIDSTITGDYLVTSGYDYNKDKETIKSANRKLKIV